MVWGGELFIQVVSGIASSLLPFASAGTVLYLLGKKKKKDFRFNWVKFIPINK